MNNQHEKAGSAIVSWNCLQHDYAITDEHIGALRRYAELLGEWNKKFNLTAIVDDVQVVERHFYDSLGIIKQIDFATVNGICDVGTGAGFPGLPLKILFPHMQTILVEVNHKKRLFLEHVVHELHLDNVIISSLDWMTFLRTTDYRVEYVFARASLPVIDLVRMFKPSVFYSNARLVYWASDTWKPSAKEAFYYDKEVGYMVNQVKRKYVFFSTR